MGAYVFCKAFLGPLANIQTAQIHSYRQGNAFFQPACDGLQGTPRVLRKTELVGVEGGNDLSIIRLP